MTKTTREKTRIIRGDKEIRAFASEFVAAYNEQGVITLVFGNMQMDLLDTGSPPTKPLIETTVRLSLTPNAIAQMVGTVTNVMNHLAAGRKKDG